LNNEIEKNSSKDQYSLFGDLIKNIMLIDIIIFIHIILLVFKWKQKQIKYRWMFFNNPNLRLYIKILKI
jgi:hypothetical protein